MATSVAIKISFVSARCAARQSTTLSFPVIQRAGSTLQANITPTAPFLLSSHYGTGPSDFQHPHVLHAAGAYPIVIDTGASVSVTPNASDFVGGLATDNLPDLRGLSHTSKVTGTGLVEWSIYNVHGRIRKIRTRAFYVPDATIRLFLRSRISKSKGVAICAVPALTLLS